MNSPSVLIEKVLTRVAKKLNIEKWRYELENMSGNMVNYMGNLFPVALIDKTSDVTIYLMIKTDSSALVPAIEPFANGAYKREDYVYTTLVPLFKKIANNSDDFFPECYFADSSKDNRVLVLQNMSVFGFERHNKGRFLDKEHIILILEAVAKLHSFSLILREKNIEPPNNEVMEPFMTNKEPHYAYCLKRCFKKYGVDLFEGTQFENFFKNMYSSMDDMTQFIENSVKNAHTLVYGHGDIWKENFLFKYIDNKPVQVCLLDYQLTHLMTPARDVLFLLINSIESSIRREHYQTFLSTYYKALKVSLKANGIDPSTVYSEEKFRDDIKLVFPMCFCVTIFSFALWLGLENLISLVDTAGSVNVDTQKDNVELFIKIIGDIITDFRDFGTTST
ncbi:hypothetical protein ABMA28_008273 [Loxostege sticticalis]|uniref:CHK kinase-like domain-containing protein n=1 Tax=Loxostege sticticalis TaxID=481309 RepID=A0ABD0SKH5_LOXSC